MRKGYLQSGEISTSFSWRYFSSSYSNSLQRAKQAEGETRKREEENEDSRLNWITWRDRKAGLKCQDVGRKQKCWWTRATCTRQPQSVHRAWGGDPERQGLRGESKRKKKGTFSGSMGDRWHHAASIPSLGKISPSKKGPAAQLLSLRSAASELYLLSPCATAGRAIAGRPCSHG